MLSRLGAKLAGWLGEQDTGAPGQSAFGQTLAAWGQQPLIADLLPYGSFDEATQLFHNADTTGFVLETLPLTGASEEMQKEVSSLFQYILPEGSSLQTILWADPHIGDICDGWETVRQDKNPVIQKLAQRRSAFLKAMAFESPQSPYVLRNFRCLLAYSQPLCSHNPVATEKAAQLVSQLKTALEMLRLPVRVWRPEDLITTLEGMLCLEPGDTQPRSRRWDPLNPISSQVVAAGSTLEVGANNLSFAQGRVQARTYKIRSYPEVWTLHAMGLLAGDPERDMAQIPCPFILHYGVHVPPQDGPQKRVSSKAFYVEAQSQSAFAKYLPALQREAAELRFVRENLAKSERIVQTHFTIALFTQAGTLPKAGQILRNLFKGQEWDLEPNWFLHLPMLLSILPMTWGPAMVTTLANLKKLKTTQSTESANLLPLQGEWHGTPSPGLILAGRKGQIFTWSPFDSSSNYNVCVVGQSGAGKSVFMQEVVMGFLGTGGRVIVLDVGRSFQKLGQILGGQFIRVTHTARISLNPFSNLGGSGNDPENLLNTLVMIRQVIASMVSPSGMITELENSFLEIALKSLIQEKGADTEVSDVAAWFLAHPDQRVQDMGARLYSFTRDGIYGRFFTGPSTISFTNPLVIAEFEDIKQSRELSAVVLQILIVNILTLMYRGDRQARFALIVDEAWEFLAGRAGEALIETAARQARKYGGLLVVGSQNAEDFHRSLAAKAAFNNSAWKCYLSQPHEALKAFEKEDLITSPAMLGLLRTIRMSPGKYGESLMVSDAGYAVARLILDPFSLLLYSTKADEFSAVERLVAQGVPVEDAIDQLLNQRNRL